MARYLLRRLLSGLLMLLIFVSIVFFATQILLPGDYVSQFTLGLSPEEAQELREQLGLNRPILERYMEWLSDVLRGDLGYSFSFFGQGAPVGELVGAALPATALVFGVGAGLAFGIGQWLGKRVAWSRNRLLAGTTTFGAITLYTAFPPWLVFLLGYFLADQAGLFPRPTPRSLAFGAPSVHGSEALTRMMLGLLVIGVLIVLLNRLVWRLWRRRVPGFLSFVLLVLLWVVSWSALEIRAEAQEVLLSAALPIIAVTLLTFGEIMLIMRTTMIDTQHEDFVRTARAKGLSEGVVRDRHAARIALLPVVSRMVISLPYLMAGVVMIEQTTGWSGMGSMLFYGVGQQNVPLMTGVALAIGAFSLITRLALDVIYVYLDPRVYSGAEVSRRYL